MGHTRAKRRRIERQPHAVFTWSEFIAIAPNKAAAEELAYWYGRVEISGEWHYLAWNHPGTVYVEPIEPRDDYIIDRMLRSFTRHSQLMLAGRMYDPEIHDEDSVFFRDTYTGPSERDLMGGCNRCGGWDDCYCPDPPTKRELRDYEAKKGPSWSVKWSWNGGPQTVLYHEVGSRHAFWPLRMVRQMTDHVVNFELTKKVKDHPDRVYTLTSGGGVYEI